MIFLVGGWSLAAGVVVTGQDNSTFVSPDNAPPLLYRVAQFQYRAGEPADAIATLHRIVTNSSVVPVRHRLAQIPIQTLLGQCHESLGDLDAALVAYERALGVAAQTPDMLALITWDAMETRTRSMQAMATITLRRSGLINAARSVGVQLPRIRLTELPRRELWPSASRIPVANLPPHVLVGAPRGDFFIGQQTMEEVSAHSGLDVPETLRMLALAGLRRRVLLGRALTSRSPLAGAVLSNTEIPNDLATRGSRLVAMPRSLREVLRYHAGQAMVASVVESSGLVDGGSHAVAPVSTLALLHSTVFAWDLVQSAFDAGDAVAPGARPATHRERLALMQRACAAADLGAAHGQYELIDDAMAIGLRQCEQLAQHPAHEVSAAMEEFVVASLTMSRVLRDAAVETSLRLRLLAAEASLVTGHLATVKASLSDVRHEMDTRRLILPALEANWSAVSYRYWNAVNPSSDHQVTFSKQNALHSLRAYASGQDSWADTSGRANRSTHRMILRTRRLADSQLGGINDAARETVYRECWKARDWAMELSPIDRIASCIDTRDQPKRVGIRLADSLGDSALLLQRVDDWMAHRLRSRSVELPTMTDWRSAAREVQVDHQAADRLMPSRIDRRDQLQQLAIDLDVNRAVLSDSADTLLARAESKLARLGWDHGSLSRVSPPRTTITHFASESRRTRRLAKIPSDTAILVFAIVDETVMAILHHDGETTDWTVGSAAVIRSQTEAWLRSFLDTEPRNQEADQANNQMTFDLRSRWFPPLCGVDDIDAKRLVVVADGMLWQLPWDRFIRGDQPDRFPSIRFAATPGYAFTIARDQSNQSSRGGQVARWDGSLGGPIAFPSDPGIWRGPLALNSRPRWWGQDIAHLMVTPPSESKAQNESLIRRGLPTGGVAQPPLWSSECMKAPTQPIGNVIDGSVQMLWGTPSGGDAIWQHAGRLHAGGVDRVVLCRWRVPTSAIEAMQNELALELPHVPFEDAFQRARAILAMSEFESDSSASSTAAVDGGTNLIQDAWLVLRSQSWN
ncbi:MAG: tetratricopeptide repeat protein [Planctomycetota bacterium]